MTSILLLVAGCIEGRRLWLYRDDFLWLLDFLRFLISILVVEVLVYFKNIKLKNEAVFIVFTNVF